ncbi:MAG: LPXTG cell wall anchor domain-containing protein [Myxococcales bacterium]|nr:LPXTG cell wall anchor domain-containing protein [Myxococcales bacterium]
MRASGSALGAAAFAAVAGLLAWLGRRRRRV